MHARVISYACTGVLIHSSTGSFHLLFSDLCCDLKKTNKQKNSWRRELGLWLRAWFLVCLSEPDISLDEMLD